MPNRKEHIKSGGWTGAGALMFLNLIAQAERKRQDPTYQFNFVECAGLGILGYGGGAIGAQLPDIFEPANHPGHRDFFHSIAFGTLAMLGAKKLNDNPAVSNGVKMVVNTGTLGYLSHLVMDGGTPAGLPI